MVKDKVLAKDWHPVALAAKVPEGKPLAAKLLGQDIVLWRQGDRYMAWQDLCIHRGAKLSLGVVKDNCLQCPYHGWLYDTDGKCVKIPAHPEQVPPPRAKTEVYSCQEKYGWIWVSFSESPEALPDFPEWQMPGYRILSCGPYPVKASGPRVIENFLDLAHLCFVHEGILGMSDRAEIEDYQVIKTDKGVEALDIRIWQPAPIVGTADTTAHYTYKVLRPLAAYLDKVAEGQRFSMLIVATPLEETESLAWILTGMTGAEDMPEADMHAFMEKIFMQDVPIMESQKPERLPLDLQQELHLRCDRTSIAYRQWLNELGLSFGTS